LPCSQSEKVRSNKLISVERLETQIYSTGLQPQQEHKYKNKTKGKANAVEQAKGKTYKYKIQTVE